MPKIHIFGIPTPLVEEPEEKEIFVAKEEVIIEEEKYGCIQNCLVIIINNHMQFIKKVLAFFCLPFL